MTAPPVPPDEAARLVELHSLQILDTPTEERFDRITRAARDILDVPIAGISLVDADRQWFKSCQGLAATQTPRPLSFCGHAILVDDILVVPDTRADERFSDNPLVTGEPGIRFYAGQPIHGPEGHRVGTLCVLDYVPRAWKWEDNGRLQGLAAWCESEVNAVTAAMVLDRYRESEARVHGLTESLADAALIIDETGTIHSVNRATELIFGYARTEMLGSNLRMLMPDAHAPHHEEYLADFLDRRIPHLNWAGCEVEGRRKDGSVFPMELAISETRLQGKVAFIGILRDISQRKQAQQELAHLHAYLQAILDSATHVSIIATDPRGTIKVFNRGAERMLGHASRDVVDRSTLTSFFSPQEIVQRGRELTRQYGHEVEGFDVLVEQARRVGFEDREWTCIRKNGAWFSLTLVVTPLHDANGGLDGFLGIAHDITDRKAVERMKSEFVSVVSHELRTPLTSIRASLGLLTSGALGSLPAQRLLEIAVTNADRLVRLVNDILDLERIESGSVALDKKRCNAADLMRQSVDMLRAEARAAQVILEFTPLDAVLWADPDRIVQTLTNLLSNAVKFSDAGDTVTLAAHPQGRQVWFTVADEGRGIPADKLDVIFERFQQVDASDSRQRGGTGLGLAICRSIVRQHGGRIWVESVVDQGSSFHFTVEALPGPVVAGEHDLVSSSPP